MMYKTGVAIWAAFVFFWVQNTSLAQDYTFSSVEGHADQIIGASLLVELYRIAGHDIQVIPLPGERAIELSTSGYYDGETIRVHAFGETHPQMYRITTPLYQFHSVALSKTDRDLTIDSLEDLRPLNVLRVNGVIYSKMLTQNLPDVRAVTHMDNMLKMLSIGRADVAVASQINSQAALIKNGLQEQITIHAPILWTQGAYHYIHRKNKTLAQNMDPIIRRLAEDGDLAVLMEEMQNRYYERIRSF